MHNVIGRTFFLILIGFSVAARSQDASTPDGLIAVRRHTLSFEGKAIRKFAGEAEKFTLPGNIFSNTSPAVYEGIVYVGTDKSGVIAIEGSTKRTAFESDGAVIASPAVSAKYVLTAYSTNKLICYDRTGGGKLWEYTTKAPICATPLIAEKVAVASCTDGSVYAIGLSSGSFKWKFSAVSHAFAPAYYREMIFVGNDKDRVYMLDEKNGDVKWEYRGPGGGDIVLSEDLVYCREKPGTVATMDLTTGTREWIYRGELRPPTTGMSIGGDMLLFGNDLDLMCLDRRAGKRGHWVKNFANSVTSTPIVAGDVIYVGCGDGKLYAVDLGSGAELDRIAVCPKPIGTPAFAVGKIYFPCGDTIYIIGGQ